MKKKSFQVVKKTIFKYMLQDAFKRGFAEFIFIKYFKHISLTQR